MDANLFTKMELFSELIRCGQKLSFWELTPHLDLIRTTCENSQLYHSILLMDESFPLLCAQNTLELGRPVLYTNSVGLSWICAAELAGETVCRVYVVGPAFISNISYITLENTLTQKKYPRELIQLFMDHIQELATISLEVWMRYALMLHHCITGEQLEIFDLQYADMAILASPPSALSKDEAPAPKEATWYAEQMVMKMVEEGNLDYKPFLTELSNVGSSVVMSPDIPLRKMKNYMIAMNGLVTRAAIRGGVDIATAYHLGEIYLNAIEEAPSMAALMHLSTSLYEDFIQRVHKVRDNPGISTAVRTCCGYIERHLGEKLTMEILADQVGYAEYYMAQKFKKEMGMTVSRYIRKKRVEQAKLLLRSTNQSIGLIGDQLGFCNSSHFSDSFRSEEGMTPAEYRDRGK